MFQNNSNFLTSPWTVGPPAPLSLPAPLPVPRSELGADAAAGAQEENWVPSITVKQILLAIQHLLDTPNPNSPAQGEAYNIYMNTNYV